MRSFMTIMAAGLAAVLMMTGCEQTRRVPGTPVGGEFPVLVPYFADHRWGFIDTSGSVVIPARFHYAYPFSEGLARVKVDSVWGYVDRSGSLVIPAQYERARDFSDGMAGVRMNRKWGYVDRTGALAVPARYSKLAGKFSEGLAAVPDSGGKWGYLDKTGAWAIPPLYDRAGSFAMGRAPVRIGDRYGFASRAGKLLGNVDFLYSDRYANGLALVRTGEPTAAEFAFVDSASQVKFTVKADEVFAMSEGLARARVGEKWGYINPKGKFAIPARYDFALDFKEGLAAVRDGDGWGYINNKGEMVIPKQFLVADKFNGGLAYVTFKGGWGYVNREGRIVWKTEQAATGAGEED